MIVADASALLELILGTSKAERVGARALAAGERLHAPHLLDIEVAQALRRMVQLKNVTTSRAEQALEAPLLTCDAKLARSHGHSAKIELVS